MRADAVLSCSGIQWSATSWLSAGFYHPAVGMIDHSYDLSQNLIASVIKLGEDLFRNIAMPKSNLDMHLGFRGLSLRVIQLRHEGTLVPPLSPRLCHIRAYRTRGSFDLIRKRVLLLWRKLLGQFKDTHYQLHSSLINVQFTKMLTGSQNMFFRWTMLSLDTVLVEKQIGTHRGAD
jgi:hypothetical protein